MTNLTQGDDTFHGGAGDDIVNGLGGNDTITGDAGDDILSGGAGNDSLDGGADDDQLSGGSGDDTLTGGLGNDTFTGGTGNDTVVINATAVNGMASQAGNQLTIVSADGVDTLNAGIEHIQFNNVTIDMVGGDATAHLGADSNEINQAGSASGNAASNDIDIDDTMTITGIHSDNMNVDGSLGSSLSGQYGSLTLNADGTYSYSAGSGTISLGEGESVTDTFTYSVNSGGVNSTQTISIVIDGTNDTPSITSLAGSATYNDTLANDTFTPYNSTLTASDADTNDTLTFGATGATANNTQVGFDMAVAGSYGTLYINSSTGAYEYIPNNAAMQAAKTSVSDSFTFTVSDGHGGTDSQAFVVQINGVNDKPVLGAITPMSYTDTSGDDTFLTQSGTLVGTDRDNDALTYHATGESINVSQSGFDHAVAGTYGTLYFNASTGAYEYIPNDGAIEGLKTTASDTFTFSATDGQLSTLQQTLTVTLNGTNDTPVIVASSPTTELTESGGVNNGNSGTLTASSTMTLSDRDTGDTPSFDTSALTTGGWVNDGGGFWHKIGTYGTATLDTATGHVTYGLNDSDNDTQALQVGDTVHDIFTLYVTDGTAGSSTTVDFTIHGANDNAIVSGTLSGTATEASGANNGTAGTAASGTATDTDVDNTANTFQVIGSATASTNGYGTYTVDASGHWVFTVNESNATVEALNVGASLSDTFTIHTADGTSQTITVTIQGANDAAVVTGTTTGEVVESGGALFSGTAVASGTLDDTDVDNTSHLFAASSGSTDHSYGSYAIDASGHWSFTLNNANLTVQALNDGDHLTETFTVHTTDGTAQVVTITIDGHNEVFNGTSGNDGIKGTVYGDTMTGGDGNDVYIVNNTHDVVVESADQGEDLVQTSVTYTLSANVEDLTMSGNQDIGATGNELGNLMVGNNGNNLMLGMGGDDVIRAGAGNDTVEGGDGDDNLDGGNGVGDTVSYAHASAGVTVNLTLTSFQNTVGAGFDKVLNFENVTGSAFDDTLTGTAGRNVITGGGGADTMTGGAAADTFVYTAASDSAFGHADTITDIVNADKIDLSAIATDFVIGGSSFHNIAHEIVLTYNSGTNMTTIAIDMNGNGNATDAGDMQILLNGDHHTFSNFGGLGIT